MIAWILIPVGISVIVYTEKIVGFMGEVALAEKFFGTGGTYTFMKLFGLTVTVLSFLWVTGGLQPILYSTFGMFFPR